MLLLYFSICFCSKLDLLEFLEKSKSPHPPSQPVQQIRPVRSGQSSALAELSKVWARPAQLLTVQQHGVTLGSPPYTCCAWLPQLSYHC